MSFLDIAWPLAERGFRVFPLVPRQKFPLPIAGDFDHFDAATTDEGQIRTWDKQEPNANVGISPDEIFCFLETDSESELKELCADIPADVWDTTRVSSGRPDRAYYIFRQTMRTKRAGNMTATREDKDNLFEFKQHRCLVVGPGSIHPKTGLPYGVEWKRVPAMPDVLLNRLCELDGKPKAASSGTMGAETKRQTELLDRFLATYQVATTGDWFNKGKQWYRPIECPWKDAHENPNEGTSTCVVYIEGGGYGFDCKHRCASKTWKEFRAELERRFADRKFSFGSTGDVPEAVIGATLGAVAAEPPKPLADWRTHYHSFEEMEKAPPTSFLIDGFLPADAITALAAPVGQRKSLAALNVAHAVCTKEPLFDYFAVTKQPSRVLYLCPEMGLRSFTDRLRKIGLMPYVGKTLFCRTMSAEGTLGLDELTAGELDGALVVIDTAVRYLKGDENSSEHMRQFAESIFRLMRDGAVSVLLLHHSAKGTKESSELSLENAMRGSGELGAFVSSCWATRLQDPDEPYKSASFFTNVKQRDFESQPFEVTSGPDCRLHIVGDPALKTAVLKSRKGNKADKDGLDDAAETIIGANPGLSARKLKDLLAERGIERGVTWIAAAKKRFLEEHYATLQASGGKLG
jgi:hypothetical protein